MKVLQTLVESLSVRQYIGILNRPIKQLDFDSRTVTQDSLFFAIKGTQVDGHEYIEKAIEKGASTIICEHLPAKRQQDITYILVENSAIALGILAHNFYEQPSLDIKLIGVTGTNGKTTSATLLHDLFVKLGYKVGLLSTVENKIAGEVIEASHTTPDAVSLNRLLAQMVVAGCEFAFMEVSSHAIDQHRIAGLTFQGGIFTNISHDHLDYHETFKAYINAKKTFFDHLPKTAFALTNIDDKRGAVMVQNTKAKIKSYSLKRLADFKAKILDNSLLGLNLDIDGESFYGQLIGEFNAYNTLSVYATAILLGMDKLEVLTALSNIKSAEGRFDYIVNKAKNITAIVDYAHTPDALEKVLKTIAQLRTGNEQVITVVGCGGDRDKAKRPIMAKTACEYSNHIIITSDNPRTEKPEAIIEDMEKGIPANALRKTISINNRLQAIRTACRLAQNGDIILVAGKGHEKYQEINGVKHPFDDKAILKEELGQL